MHVSVLKHWFFGLGANYGVDPLIFGIIYVGSSPLMWLSVAWLIQNLRRGQSPVLPAISAGFFFLSANLYVIAVGHNVPAWVYGMMIIMLILGAVSTLRSVKKKVRRDMRAPEEE
ncbi:MAG: hypothetical protein M3Y56_05790 [Armatimonadota bacterium]|nr:hypothetical protein [Armatimonadota bacterium]